MLCIDTTRAADVFVIATLEDDWSLVVPEAMACGLPILSSLYNGAVRSWSILGETAMYSIPCSPRPWPSSFGTCLRGAATFLPWGVAAQRIVSDYTPEAAAKEILRACVIARGRRSTEGVTC